MDPEVAAALITACTSLVVSLIAAFVAWRSANREEQLRQRLPELEHLLKLREGGYQATHLAFSKSCSAIQEYRDALEPLLSPADSLLGAPLAENLRRAHDGLLACYQE